MIKKFIVKLVAALSLTSFALADTTLDKSICYLDVCIYEQVNSLNKLSSMLEQQTSSDLDTLTTYDTIFIEVINTINKLQDKRKVLISIQGDKKHKSVNYSKYIEGESALIHTYGQNLNEDDLKTIDNLNYVEYLTVKGAAIKIPDTKIESKTKDSITLRGKDYKLIVSGITPTEEGGIVGRSTGRVKIQKVDSSGNFINPLIKE